MLVILLRVQMPTRISNTFELFVGLMLIVLGLWAVLNAKKQKFHFHVHSHDGKSHAHLHSHRESESHDHPHIPFSVGIVHGLAGSGALVVLVMSTMAGVVQGLVFIAAFGGGLILAMSVIGSVLSLPMSYGGKFTELIGLVFQVGAAVLSMGLGVLVVIGYLF
jgi:sulfite exporter TauE/SafE